MGKMACGVCLVAGQLFDFEGHWRPWSLKMMLTIYNHFQFFLGFFFRSVGSLVVLLCLSSAKGLTMIHRSIDIWVTWFLPKSKISEIWRETAAGVESKECHEHLAKLGGIEVLVNQLDSWSGDLKVADPAASEWCISWIYAIRPKFLEDFFLFLGKKSKYWGLRVLFPISSLIVIYL